VCMRSWFFMGFICLKVYIFYVRNVCAVSRRVVIGFNYGNYILCISNLCVFRGLVVSGSFL
jgi:hypothetical protein